MFTLPGRASTAAALLPILFLIGCAGGMNRLQQPTAEPVFYPAPPDSARIQFLTRFRSSADIEPQGQFEKYVVGERPEFTLQHAYGIAAYDGKIYVCDSRAGTILTLDLRRSDFDWIKTDRRGQMQKPLTIAIAEDGRKYVADPDQSRVIVLSRDDKIVDFFGGPDLFRPVDVAVFGDRLYVADMKDKEIEVLDRQSGEPLDKIGEIGPEPGQFSAPTALTVDTEGNLYVTDLLNARVQKFDPEGNLLFSFGQVGRLPGDFARPKGIAVDREGVIYVVDSAFENVQMFNKKGEILMFFGGYGDEDGSMWLPSRITLDYDPDDIAYFQNTVADGYDVEYLILISNQIGPSHVGLYGFLKPRR